MGTNDGQECSDRGSERIDVIGEKMPCEQRYLMFDRVNANAYETNLLQHPRAIAGDIINATRSTHCQHRLSIKIWIIYA